MKLILRNTNLVFEKSGQKVVLSDYDSFSGQIFETANIGYVNATADDKKIKLYNVSALAGKKVNVVLYFNISPSSPDTTVYIASFSKRAVTHEDATQTSPYVLVMDNGVISSDGMTKDWWSSTYPASCKITGEITIPADSVAMAVTAGTSNYTGVSYPDHLEVYYYE